MSTLMKLEKKPAGVKWREELLKTIVAELDAGKVITIDAKTPTMTPQQVAQELGLSRTTVLRKITSGALRASKRGNRNIIAVADFERFRAGYVRELGQAFADDF
ncbi:MULTISPECIES: helix-turn-helix domain-containing protein [Microbacterium]|uniref:helix-turn-helix domain-containing protein n=1 Tax=Microbacterium TaxID=33882 RepID=UPI00142D556F|nr:MULTISPECIES: helix-turn-helix domain-containing protein [Microbacterium]MDF2558595.1 binding domain protein excisionase family [Microbacterium sp.]NJI60346.1 helix-turn-helix domain-containing protein [Microbacterium sp. B19(2022)]